jgi:O-antigen/teichoic acid export membrane protein
MSERPDDTVVALSHRTVATGGLISLGARVAALVLGVVVTAVLARELGPEQFGYLALMFALVAAAAAVSDFGTSQVAIREMAARPDDRAGITAGLIRWRVLSSALLGVIVIITGIALVPDNAARMAALVGLAVPVGAFGSLQAVAQARLRLDLVSVVFLAQSVAWLGAVLAVASMDGGLTGYAVAFLLAALVQAAIALAVTTRVTELTWSGPHRAAIRLLSMSWSLGLAGVFVAIYYRLDNVLLFGIDGADAAGLYAAAYKVLDVLQLFPAIVAAVLLPYLSIAQRRPADAMSGRALELALCLLGLIALPVATFGAVLAEPLVVAFYGAEFREAGPLLTVLLPAYVGICLGWISAALLIAEGRIGKYTLIVGGAAAICVVANVIFIPLYGAMATAVITLVTEGLVGLLITFLALGRERSALLPFGRWARTLAACMVGLGVALLMREQPVAAAVSASLAAYLVLALLLGAVRVSELRVLLGDRTLVRA